MSENRKEQIMATMQGSDILMKDRYSAQELLPQLKIFMHSLLKVIYEETHAEIMDCKSMLKHLEELAEKYGLKDLPKWEELKKDMMTLSNRIKALEMGRLGEKYGRQALSRGQEKKNVLSNVALEVEGERAEIDFIAITQKAVFVVEAKHNMHDMVITESGNYVRADGKMRTRIYNIGQSMNAKKYIVAKKIEEFLAQSGRTLKVPVQSIILYTNNYSKLTDNYHYEQVCYCSNLPHYIDNYAGNENVLSDAERKELEVLLRDASIELEYPTEIEANRIRENLAEVLAALEETARKHSFLQQFEEGLTRDFEEELCEATVETEEASCVETSDDICEQEKEEKVRVTKQRSLFWNLAKASAGVVLVGAGAMSIFRRKR